MTEAPAIHDLEILLGIPVRDWFGNCFKIAKLTADIMGLYGRAAYGWWTGPTSDLAVATFKRNAQGHIRHGWVVMPNGVILDLTRWALTGEDPFIYYGINDFYADGQFVSWRVPEADDD